MELRDLSKMQIRAEVMMILQQLSNYDEIPRAEEDKLITQLSSIQNRDQLLEILTKEFARADYKKGKIIAMFLSELGTLEQLKDSLWTYIKAPDAPDSLKDLAGIVLRNLGDNTDPELFLSYLNDPKEIIDNETEKLLAVANINPEAQIDFLDFLFSLPEEEQINLINSLKSDFLGQHLANILVTTLDSNPQGKLREICIEALGETKSPIAASILIDIIESTSDEFIQRIAKKSLNMLKLSGVNIDDNITDTRGMEICQNSEIYECYTSIVDGAGNQGIIVSRIKENQDIIMFSVVVNDLEGIIDCFGFSEISKDDFSRIILRFQEESTKISVSPEYCKYLLKEAETISKSNNTYIPYEYIAWKALLYDIHEPSESIEELTLKWGDLNYIIQGETLYKHPDFKYWFFEEDDYPIIKESLETILHYAVTKRDHFVNKTNDFISYLEEQVSFLLISLFDDKLKENYKKRLLNVAYLLHCQELNNFKKIASSIAVSLEPDSNFSIDKSPFFREMMRKTISEGFLRCLNNLDPQSKRAKINSWSSKSIEEFNNIPKTDSIISDLNVMIDILYNTWQKS